MSIITAYYRLLNKVFNIIGWLLFAVASIFIALVFYTNVVGDIQGAIYPWTSLFWLLAMLFTGRSFSKINFEKIRIWVSGA